MGLINKVYYGPDGIARRVFDHYTHFPLLAECAPHLRWWLAVAPNAWLDGKLTVSTSYNCFFVDCFIDYLGEEPSRTVEVRRVRSPCIEPMHRLPY
jgi:hypothetical protein